MKKRKKKEKEKKQASKQANLYMKKYKGSYHIPFGSQLLWYSVCLVDIPGLFQYYKIIISFKHQHEFNYLILTF